MMTVETPVTSHPAWPRQLRILITARVVDRLGGFTLAFLPLLLVTSYGASLRTAGLVTAAFGAATVPSRLLGGRLADRLGRRATIVLGLSGCAAAQLALAVSPGVRTAALSAVALGLCFEIYEPPSQALLADLVPPDRRASAFSALGAAMAAAGVLAGLLAAALAGAGVRWLFLLDALTCVSCAALVRVGLDGGRPVPQGTAGTRSPWRDPRLLAMAAVGTAFATVYLVMLGGLPLALHQDGIAPAWAGVLMAVSAVTVILGRRLVVRLAVARGPFHRMRLGYLLVAAGLGSAAVTSGLLAVGPVYLFPVVLWSVGDVILLGEPFAVVAGLAGAADRGRYLAAYGVSWGLAATVAPLLAAALLAAGGSVLLWLCCAVVAAGLAAVQDRLGAAVTRQ